MKLNAFLTALGKKIGFDLTDVKLKDILASEAEIPDEFTEALEKGLMTEDAAKNNSKIKAAIKAEAYNGIDSDITSFLEELGLGEDVAKPIKEQKKTIDKVKSIAAHLKSEAEKAGKAGDKETEKALKQQVADLNGQLKKIREDSQKSIDQLKSDNENALNDFSFKTTLGTRQFALPDAMNQEEKVNMVHGIVSSQLKSKGYKIIRNTNGALELVKEDGTPAYDEKNNPVTLDTFTDGALAQRGLLKQTAAAPAAGGNGQQILDASGKEFKAPVSVTTAVSQLDQMIADASKN